VLSKHIYDVQHSLDPLSIQSTTHHAFNSIQSAMDWTSPTGKSTLYRLLLVLPWPAVAVDDINALHAKALGSQFDATVAANNRLHRLANSWVLWAIKRMKAITMSWKSRVDQL
jgi:hypothetical protein